MILKGEPNPYLLELFGSFKRKNTISQTVTEIPLKEYSRLKITESNKTQQKPNLKDNHTHVRWVHCKCDSHTKD